MSRITRPDVDLPADIRSLPVSDGAKLVIHDFLESEVLGFSPKKARRLRQALIREIEGCASIAALALGYDNATNGSLASQLESAVQGLQQGTALEREVDRKLDELGTLIRSIRHTKKRSSATS